MGKNSTAFSKEREEINELIAQSEKPQVVKVRDKVYVAVGYTLANMIIIETSDGLVIVDTTESITAAKTIMSEFRKITDKAVKVVIYTHYHADHFLGTGAFYQPGMKVIAHQKFTKEVKFQREYKQSNSIRAGAMFGLDLPQSDRFPMILLYPKPCVVMFMRENIAPKDIVWPTETFNDKKSFKLGDITFNLIHAPGETADQINVEIPELKTVCCGDNFYGSFPNLYTIRGTRSRPVTTWADSLDMVIEREPEILLPSHGFPLVGKDTIKEVLGNYRDAILHVHNLALEAVQSFTPIDDVAAKAALPSNLAELPYLKQTYGYIPHCVRDIYQSYVSWFDGDPVNLNPLSREELGAEIIELVGSAKRILEQADKAQKAGRHQAVLELCQIVLSHDQNNREARQMKISSLLALSNKSINKPTVNYFNSFAAIEEKKLGDTA